jgi:hypothetical protein
MDELVHGSQQDQKRLRPQPERQSDPITDAGVPA